MGKNKTWIAVDIAMAAAMLLLMAYALVGEFAHECIGAAAGALVITHVWLSRRRIKALPRGRWNAGRILRTVVALALAAALVATMAMGVATSHYLFADLSSFTDALPFEIAHMTAAHWAFALAGIHLGLNGKRLAATASSRSKDKRAPRPKDGRAPRPFAAARLPRIVQAATVVLPILVALLGIAAFVRRGIWRYLFGLNHFALMNPAEPVWHCVAEYVLVAALFIVIGAVAGKAAGRFAQEKGRRKEQVDA